MLVFVEREIIITKYYQWLAEHHVPDIADNFLVFMQTQHMINEDYCRSFVRKQINKSYEEKGV